MPAIVRYALPGKPTKLLPIMDRVELTEVIQLLNETIERFQANGKELAAVNNGFNALLLSVAKAVGVEDDPGKVEAAVRAVVAERDRLRLNA